MATIKPFNAAKGGPSVFLSFPGGRVLVGAANLKMMIQYALAVPDYQIVGLPEWALTQRYDVVGLPPASSLSRTAAQPSVVSTPSEEQRQMLETLLVERFGFRFHREVREGPIFLLTRGGGKLQMQDAKDKDADSRGGVIVKGGGTVDGEAFGTNISMEFFAKLLSRDLSRPVLDKTELPGRYDFHLPATDPENRDRVAAVLEAVSRLGLKLKADKGPVVTIVVDNVQEPTEN